MAESQCFIEKAGSFPLASLKWKAAKMRARYKIVNAVDKFTASPKSSRKSNGEEHTAVVGPVIGKVTTTSARILLEISKTAFIEMTLVEELEQDTALDRTGSGSFLQRLGSSQMFLKSSKESLDHLEREEHTVGKVLQGNRATIFEFTDLIPGTRYSIKVGDCSGAVPSSFKTFPEVPPETFCIGAVSCNSIFITRKTITHISDLWAHLAKNIDAGRIDLLVHLGDQIYGDGDKLLDAQAGRNLDKWSNRFKMAKAMMRDIPREQWKQKQEEICEKYREVYRETWQHPHTAKCLANCPNLMIYDDHEVRDNWGDLPEDWDTESLDFFIARCAWIANLEYQRQLHEDIDFSNLQTIKTDYHFHVIGGVGLMFLDIRGSRTFHRVEGDEKPYLGSQQWEDIKKALGKGGIFDKIRVLLVCSPAPLAFLEPTITKTAANNVNRLEDFKGHWSAQAHKKEQVEMIECLQTWKASRQGGEVLVLGGDVHCGGHSYILKAGKVLFHQLTTSAIANMPLPKSAYYFMRAAEQLGHLQGGYAFSHHHWTRARNYGVVQIKNYRAQDFGETEIITQLIRGKFMRPVRMGRRVSTLKESTTTRCSAYLCHSQSASNRQGSTTSGCTAYLCHLQSTQHESTSMVLKI